MATQKSGVTYLRVPVRFEGHVLIPIEKDKRNQIMRSDSPNQAVQPYRDLAVGSVIAEAGLEPNPEAGYDSEEAESLGIPLGEDNWPVSGSWSSPNEPVSIVVDMPIIVKSYTPPNEKDK